MQDMQVILALIAILAVTMGIIAIMPVMQVEARGCENGAAPSTGFNASKGRCFGH